MAHFYGSMIGSRSERTCLAGKNGAINAHIRGWNVGAKVYIRFNEETQKDEVTVYKTGGSNGAKSDKVITTFTE